MGANPRLRHYIRKPTNSFSEPHTNTTHSLTLHAAHSHTHQITHTPTHHATYTLPLHTTVTIEFELQQRPFSFFSIYSDFVLDVAMTHVLSLTPCTKERFWLVYCLVKWIWQSRRTLHSTSTSFPHLHASSLPTLPLPIHLHYSILSESCGSRALMEKQKNSHGLNMRVD